MDSKFISTTIGNLKDLTSGIESDVIVEDSIVIHIESAIKGDSTINIQSGVEINSTMNSQCASSSIVKTNDSVTIVRVNSESIDAVTISDSEIVVSAEDKQVAIDASVMTNIKGPTNSGST